MKVLASDKIAEQGLKMLRDAGFETDMKTKLSEDELAGIIGDYDALVIRSGTKVTKKIIDAAKNLKIIGRAGVGIDNVDLGAATAEGIIVVNSPEGNTIAAAEHTITLMLAMVRNIPEAYNSLRSGKWERNKFTGAEVYGKVLGVIGLGKIGSHVGRIAQSFGMRVIATDPFVTKEYAGELGIELKNLDDVLKESDIITIHVPKTKDTENLINAATIKKMKDGVMIVNVARGGIVNETDLAEALKSGKVKKAAIDVYSKEPPEPSNPVLSAPNCVIVPHLGAATEEAQVNVAIDVIEQIIEVLKGGNARTAVNIPSMKPAVLAKVQPYMALVEKLGKLASQLVSGAAKEIEVTYSGEVAEHDVSPLTLALVKGYLEPIMEEAIVNFVNAPLMAKERGIKVIESKAAEAADFKNLVSVKVKYGKQRRIVEGTMFEAFGERLVGIDGFKVDAVPSGHMLILSNIDKPGMIGKVGTFLGKHNINIAAMDVGRVKIGEKAVMVLNVDSEVPERSLKEIAKLEGIQAATAVKL